MLVGLATRQSIYLWPEDLVEAMPTATIVVKEAATPYVSISRPLLGL